VFPFNDIERTLALLDRHANRIACVLLDPMPHRIGLFPVDPAYLQAVYEWTRRNGALLAFDEVITFRSSYGGAQQWYPVRPDLTALGKIIGGGFPVGALAGREDVMRLMDPSVDVISLPHSGTFSANPMTMTAGLVAMELFTDDEVKRLNALADSARKQLREAIAVAGIPAVVNGAGSMFRIHLGLSEEPVGYRQVLPDKRRGAWLKKLLDHAHEQGIMLINTATGALSTPMTQQEIDRLSEALLDVFRAIKPDMEGAALST
jgi:glutamate-1-semialdehyde 2,1-aminomutase